MYCAHCGALINACSCGLRTYWKNAIIDSVPVAGNPAAREDVERALRKRRIVLPGERLAGYREERPFERRGAESYGAVFSATVEKPDGRIETRAVYAKAIVNLFPGIRAGEEIRRLRTLERWGIRTPRIYGCGRGTIYQEYLASDWEALLARLRSGRIPDPARTRYIDELAGIAAALDGGGAHALDFIDDLWADGEGRLYYVDAGGDLGDVRDGLPPNAAEPARRTLARYFAGADLALADERYRFWRARLPKPTAKEEAPHGPKDADPSQA